MSKKKVFAFLVGIPVAFTAVVGLAHTPFGRGLLRLLPGGSCPVNANASPRELEGARRSAAASLRGDKPAPHRRFFGQEIGKTARAELLRDPHCKEELRGAAVRCSGEDPERWLRFSETGILVAIDRMYAPKGKEAAVALAETRASELRADLTAPHATHGVFSDLRAPTERASLEYRYRDLAVDLSAIVLADETVVVREQYRATD